MGRRQKNLCANLLTQTAILAAIAQVGTGADKGTVKTLFGIGLYEESTYGGTKHTSYGGGAEIIIHGYDFEDTSQYNEIYFENTEISAGQTLRFKGQELDQDDQFRSMPSEGKLHYKTPDILTLMPTADMDVFKNFDSLTMSLDIETADQRLDCISASDCNVKYSWSYTPNFWYMAPPNVYYGAQATAVIRPNEAVNGKHSNQLPIDFRIDGTSVEWDEDNFTTDTILGKGTQRIHGIVRTEGWNKNAAVRARFPGTGDAVPFTTTSTHCNFDATDCYFARLLPSIHEISASTGYENGGQLLEITGYGLQDDVVTVDIDGIPCDVQTISNTTITCITGAKTSSTTPPNRYVGQHGVSRVHGGDSPSTTLSTQLELTASYEDWFTDTYTGFFEAPVDGNYQFHMACDDTCAFQMSISSPDDPAALQTLITRDHFTDFRNWYFADKDSDRTTFSDVITLTGGTKYYYKATHQENAGDGHISVGVEIEPTSGSHSYPSVSRQVMSFGVEHTLIRDEIMVNVTGADDLYYILMYQDKSTQEWVPSDSVQAGGTAAQFQKAIAGYYQDRFGTWPSVVRWCSDFNATAIDCSHENATSIIYNVTVPRAIWQTSVDTIMVVYENTTAEVEWTYAVQSSRPLHGQYGIRCFNEAGQFAETGPLNYDVGPVTIYNALVDACPFLRDNIDVKDDDKCHFREDCIDILIYFNRMDYELPQFEIFNITDNLHGFEGETPTMLWDIEAEFGQGKAWIDVLPFEMLYTAHTVPQVIVQVGDMPAVCANVACDYEYQSTTASITGFTFSDLQLTITGVALPQDYDYISFSDVLCDVSSSSETEIVCTLQDTQVAGLWTPVIYTSQGIVPVDAAVMELLVSPIISSVSPNTFNPAGGQEAIITGSGFPSDDSHPAITSVGFDDGTNCVVTSISSTVIKCITDSFASAGTRRRLGRDLADINLILNINNEEADFATTTADDPVSVIQITPYRVSPIVVQTIEIQFSADYPEANINTDDFAVKIVQRELGNVSNLLVIKDERPLRVVARDAAARTITVKYGGAYSGTYDLVVSNQDGNIFCDLVFEVILEVTDFSPKQGSQFGGTYVTITGGPFSDKITDNLVKIGYEYITGTNHYCVVEEMSTTELKCRQTVDFGRTTGTTSLIAFAATYEEAACNVAGGCGFEFLDIATMPTLNSVSTEWDQATETHRITVLGTDFDPSDQANCAIKIGGVKQNIVSMTTTSIVAEITTLTTGTIAEQLEVYLGQGVVNGFNSLLSGTTFAPALVELSTNEGSKAGGKIRATIKGAGTGDSLTLVPADSNTSICQTATMIEYGVLECVLKAALVPATTLRVRDTTISGNYDCAATDTSKCAFSSYAEVAQPVIETQSLTSPTQITILGTALIPADATTCVFSFAGIDSDDCHLVSATSITADFNMGVPSVQLETLGTLTYTLSDGTTEQIATNPQMNQVDDQGLPVQVGIVLPLAVTDQSAEQECSFNGGCLHEVTAQGLAATVKSGIADILICNKRCHLREDLSDANKAVCELPWIQNSASVDQFEIVPPGKIHGTVTGSSNNMNTLATDGANFPTMSGTGTGCWLKFTYPQGFIGVAEQFKFFIDYFPNKDTYNGALKFQGSNDNFVDNIDTLVTVEDEIHEGWNYYDLTELLAVTPKYKAYRMYNGRSSGCDKIGEVEVYGYEIRDSSATDEVCEGSITLWRDFDFDFATSVPLDNTVTYKIDLTPRLDKVQPRYGSVTGNEEISFTGDFKLATVADVTVTLDGLDCAVTQVLPYRIKCQTSEKIGYGTGEKGIVIMINGYGRTVLQSNTFTYVSKWSEPSTWGGLFAPVDGESVAIGEGLNLLFDLDASPEINAVIIDGGSLIFPSHSDPNHHRTFDAHIIYVQYGFIEAGTEQDPYTSKLTITMHGKKYDPYVPIYGNKCIGVRFATIDIHGVPRDVTWTSLESTVEAGATQITLVESVDWAIGEVIVITSTDFNKDHAEKRTITNISFGNNPTITLDRPLDFKHYAAVDNYGESDFIEIRAEVGLLTRNVVYRGDPETSAENQYGAHIMVHSPGDETSVGRISYTEFTDVGQAFQLGRYPIHFHMIGTVHKSYVKGNAVHQTYNRGTTIHGVHYLRIEENVYYDTMGHTIFIEDAAETKNYIYKNLVIKVKPSHSLLNTDSTPACFWITHPDNIFVGNHAAGSARYGFWFDLQTTAIGPSFSRDICPTRSKLGEFRDNVAHSVGRYGLRIFHGHDPHEKPCSGNTFNEDKYLAGEYPYSGNAPITAVYENFLGYKNNRNGIIGEDGGSVWIKNAKVADNKLAGIEMNKVVSVRDGMAGVDGAVVVGRTLGNDESSGGSRGIITPQRDGWLVKNARFYNFDFGSAAALGSCSHCFKAPATDSDGRHVDFENLQFDDATVPRRIRYQFPDKAIYRDLDGTLTEMGPGTWATSYWKHNADHPECHEDLDKYDGILCTANVQVRRLVFLNAAPGSLNGKDLYILRWVNDQMQAKKDDGSYDSFMGTASHYSIVPWRDKKNPANHWTVPFVTDSKYYIRWEHGLDFENMRIERTNWLWDKTDKNIEIVMPHYDVREAVYFRDNRGYLHPNNTIGDEKHYPLLMMGDNLVLNDTETREINFFVNDFEKKISALNMEGVRCIKDCVEEIEDKPQETGIRYWSNSSHWTKEPFDGTRRRLQEEDLRVPIEGDEVIIESGWNMIYDIEESPYLSKLEIRGKLTFLNNGTDRTLNTYNLWVRSGELEIGNETHPFEGKARIMLLGDNTENYWAFHRSIEAGNKNFVVTGTARLFGQPRDLTARLEKTLIAGGRVTQVQQGLDWVAGERVSIAATNMRTMDTDMATIESYNPETGELIFTENVKGYHYGAFVSSEEDYGVDMRAEVAMMNRTITIDASKHDIDPVLKEPWGCRILVSDFFEPNLIYRQGSLHMDYVQVYNCSQKYTWKSAIKFENAVKGGSKISHCSISEGRGVGVIITGSSNIELSNNVIADFVEFGIWAQSSKNLVINGNWVFHIPLSLKKKPKVRDFDGKTGCFMVSESVSKVTMRDNIAAGCWHHGFHFIPKKCNDNNPSYIFENNIAHSVSGYGHIAKNVDLGCAEIRDLIAYKCTEAGMHLGTASRENIGTNLRSIDNAFGVSVHPSGGTSELRDSFSVSELPENKDCPSGSVCDHCVDRIGLIIPLGQDGGHKDTKPKYQKFPLYQGGSLTGKGRVINHTFIGYKSQRTSCGSKQVALSHSLSPDYTPYANIENPIFVDLDPQALTFLPDPKDGWANPEDCVEFPCTGPVNVVTRIENAKYTFSRRRLEELGGRRQLQDLPDTFVTIANNKKYGVSSQVVPDCERVNAWNGYLCRDDNIGVLLFDSLDSDTMDRSVQPIWVQNALHGFNNKLNSFMDTCWDGFYTCQKRLSRFPTMVYQGWEEYNLEYTGTPPQKQKFFLFGKPTSNGLLITIKYPNAGAYQLFDQQNNAIMPTDWDEKAKTWAKPTGKYCGEFRFEGVINRLQFYITPNNCVLTIKPRDAIMLAIRMEFTMAEFFAKGGITTFTDRMAASLGIHRADLKVVTVYEGSTIVEFAVMSDEYSVVEVDLEKVKETYDAFVKENPDFMGSKILGAIMNGEPIFGDPFGDEDGNGHADLIDKFKEELERQRKRDEFRAQSRDKMAEIEANRGQGVVVQEKQVYVTKEPEQADTFKYVLIVSIMVLILVVAIVMLCVFRYCLRKRNEEQIAKIQKVLKQDETINVDANDSNHPEAPNAAVPLEELTQYQMKTGKNADIDLIRSAATLKVQQNKNKVNDELSVASSKAAQEKQSENLRISQSPSNASLPLYSCHSSAALQDDGNAERVMSQLSSKPKRKPLTKKMSDQQIQASSSKKKAMK